MDRCHRDVHRLAFEERRPLRDPVILDPVDELREEVPAELRVGQLPTAEPDGDLDPITILEELDRPMDFRIEVADADLRREADFLEGHRTLLALGFLLALGQIVLVLSEIEELDDRGEAIGATSTRSKPRSCAISSACGVGMTPSWAPSSSTTRTCGMRIIWLTRRSRLMVYPLRLAVAGVRRGQRRPVPAEAGG